MALDFRLIGERLKQARSKSGLTQEKMAEQIDVSVAFLSRIETGSVNINLKRLSQICNILNISEGEIINGCATESPVYLNSEFSSLLKNCPPDKMSLIYKITQTIIDN